MAISRFASRFDESPFATGTLQAEPAPKMKITELISSLTALVSLLLAHGQVDRTRFWGIIGAGVLIGFVGAYRPLFAAVRRLRTRLHDNGVVHRHQPEFRRVAREAGTFLDTNRSRTDTLAAILNQVSQRQGQQNSLVIALSQIPNSEIFRDRWHSFNVRIQHDKLSAEQFHYAVDELTAILRSHNSYCVTPIFYTFANEYREILADNEKSQFNAFQQSYRAYLERFAEFVGRLNDDFYGLPELSAVMALPKPL
jgi:hypothetical protein